MINYFDIFIALVIIIVIAALCAAGLLDRH